MVEYRLQIKFNNRLAKVRNYQEYFSTLDEALSELNEIYTNMDTDNVECLELLRMQAKDKFDDCELLIEKHQSELNSKLINRIYDMIVELSKLPFEAAWTVSWSNMYNKYADVISYFNSHPENIGLIYKVMYAKGRLRKFGDGIFMRTLKDYKCSEDLDKLDSLLNDTFIIDSFLRNTIKNLEGGLIEDVLYHMNNNYFPAYWLYMQSTIYKYLN